jgi:hypothetical protein
MTTEFVAGEKEQQVQKIKGKEAPDYRSVYANNVQISTNFFDSSLIFSEMLGVEDGALLVEHKMRVVLTLAQTKLLTLSLIQQIEGYEKRFGSINLVADIIPPELAAYAKAFVDGKNNEG